MPTRPAQYAVIALTVFALFTMFTGEIGDADTWIHLRTGQWMVANHRLPIPDPFAWTTYMGKPTYPAEYATRDLNLKHEWLGQVIEYLVWASGGATLMILFRASCVAGFCLLVGWIVWRRTAHFWLAIGAVLAAAPLARSIAVDRPYVITYLLLAITVWILDRRRPLWVLPPLFIFWANVHGGFFVGWIVVGAYCAEALVERMRGKAQADERMLWICGVGAILASGLNPAIFGVIPGMFAYRQSYLQNTLAEWHGAGLWPIRWYSALLIGAAATIIAAARRVRVADWLMFGLFGFLALSALRNVIFLALFAPMMIATYLPAKRIRVPAAFAYVAAAAIAIFAGMQVASGKSFQFHVASWKMPDGPVKFLKDHNVTAPMFNLYEWGGYLMWAAWPTEKTFVDGRALNESVFRDYVRIAYNSYAVANDVLDRYGVQVLLLEGFEYSQGTVYFLGASLADSAQTKWKLVYQDNTGMVFMRQPPAGVQPLPPNEVLVSLESQCRNHLDHGGGPRCARGLGDLFARLNMVDRARPWLEFYLAHNTEEDQPIERLYEQIRSGTFHAPTR